MVLRIGVVAEDRDAGRERVLDRPVEPLGIDEAHRDRVGLAGDRRVHRVDHLRDVGGLRAGPLIVAAEQRAGVLDAVLARHEERVGRHMVDEHEFPSRMRRERPALGRPRAGPAAPAEHAAPTPRDAAHQRAPRQAAATAVAISRERPLISYPPRQGLVRPVAERRLLQHTRPARAVTRPRSRQWLGLGCASSATWRTEVEQRCYRRVASRARGFMSKSHKVDFWKSAPPCPG